MGGSAGGPTARAGCVRGRPVAAGERHAPVGGPDPAAILNPVEDFCAQTASWLRGQGLSDAQGDWLWAHGPRILRHVADAELRRMDLLQA